MFRKKGVLLIVCLVFILSAAFMYADDTELQRLRVQGKKEGWTFTVGKTSVTEMPLSKITGLKIPKNWRQMAPVDEDVFGRQTRPLPASWDWRDYGCVTSVKNQGSCGTWAVAMLGSYEAILAVDGQGLQNLSEQYLIDCNSHGFDCNVGWWCYDDMYCGIPMESCYPYTGIQGPCNHTCTKYFSVDSWHYVGNSSSVPSTSALKQAIYDYGPVSAAVYVNSAFQYYTGGIFNYCQSSSPNHAVVLVGWNDTGGYWIMKNSWGTGWGENGYMRITYGCSNIGYGASYAIPAGVGELGQCCEIYVYDITQTIKKKGRRYQSTAVVTIKGNYCNDPIANATVEITWGGVVSGSDSGLTNSNGTVAFISPEVKSTGPFIITVTSVSHNTRNYNPDLNIETSDTAYY